MTTHTQACSTKWPCFWSSGLLCVGEKAPKALLVTSPIDISEKQFDVTSNAEYSRSGGYFFKEHY